MLDSNTITELENIISLYPNSKNSKEELTRLFKKFSSLACTDNITEEIYRYAYDKILFDRNFHWNIIFQFSLEAMQQDKNPKYNYFTNMHNNLVSFINPPTKIVPSNNNNINNNSAPKRRAEEQLQSPDPKVALIPPKRINRCEFLSTSESPDNRLIGILNNLSNPGIKDIYFLTEHSENLLLQISKSQKLDLQTKLDAVKKIISFFKDKNKFKFIDEQFKVIDEKGRNFLLHLIMTDTGAVAKRAETYTAIFSYPTPTSTIKSLFEITDIEGINLFLALFKMSEGNTVPSDIFRMILKNLLERKESELTELPLTYLQKMDLNNCNFLMHLVSGVFNGDKIEKFLELITCKKNLGSTDLIINSIPKKYYTDRKDEIQEMMTKQFLQESKNKETSLTRAINLVSAKRFQKGYKTFTGTLDYFNELFKYFCLTFNLAELKKSDPKYDKTVRNIKMLLLKENQKGENVILKALAEKHDLTAGKAVSNPNIVGINSLLDFVEKNAIFFPIKQLRTLVSRKDLDPTIQQRFQEHLDKHQKYKSKMLILAGMDGGHADTNPAGPLLLFSKKLSGLQDANSYPVFVQKTMVNNTPTAVGVKHDTGGIRDVVGHLFSYL